jgi:hypothetical protein
VDAEAGGEGFVEADGGSGTVSGAAVADQVTVDALNVAARVVHGDVQIEPIAREGRLLGLAPVRQAESPSLMSQSAQVRVIRFPASQRLGMMNRWTMMNCAAK